MGQKQRLSQNPFDYPLILQKRETSGYYLYVVLHTFEIYFLEMYLPAIVM